MSITTSGILPPAPYDCNIGGRGFLLAEEFDNRGNPTGKRMWAQKRMQFTPGSQPTPAAEPYTIEPSLEVPQVFSTWVNGVGVREQPDNTAKDSNGIWYGRYIDKCGSYLGPSAAVTAFTPGTTDAVNGGNQFIEFPVSGTRTLFCAMGRYLLKRVNDSSWTVANDFGAGNKITGLAKFRGQQAAQYLYIAYQNSSGVAQTYVVTSDVTTFVANSAGNKAVDFATFRDEIWMLSQNTTGQWRVQKAVDGDVVAAGVDTTATWAGEFVIADGIETCSHLVIGQDRLFIRSTLGLLGVNASENDVQVINGDTYKTQYQSLNACRPVAFGQFVINQAASSWYSYDPQSGDTFEIGVNTLKDNDSGIATGVHTTASPYRLWTVYTWTWNANNSTAYLWRWGEDDLINTVYSPIPYKELVPCIYGSLYEQASMVNGSIVSEIGGTTPRLYWCDAAGSISFMPLSRFSANPYSDPAVPANTSLNIGGLFTSEIYMPACTARNPAEIKAGDGITLVTKNSSSSNFYTVSYRNDQTSSYGNSSNLDNGGQYQSPVAQRNNFISPATGQWFDSKVSLNNSSSTAPPLLKAMIVYQVIRPIFKWVYVCTLRIGARVHMNSGADRGRLFDVDDDRSFIESIGGAQGMVNIITPEGSTIAVFVTNATFEYQRREPKGPPEWYATLEMTEHRPRNLNGRYSRLNPFIYSYLMQYSYGQLQNL